MTTPTTTNKALLFSSMNLKNISLSEPQKGKANGTGPSSLHIYVNTNNMLPFRFQLTEDTQDDHSRIVFEPAPPSGMNARVNLALTVTDSPEMEEFWSAYDTICINHVAKHSEAFLKQKMSETKVREIWAPCIRRKAGYASFIKARFDTSHDAHTPFHAFEANVTTKRFTSLHYSRLERGDEVLAVVQPGMLYYFQGKVGSTIDITHLVRFTAPPTNNFPFQLNEAQPYSEVAPEELFSAANVAAIETNVDPRQSDSTNRNVYVAADDGSTFKIDPVTMLPIFETILPSPSEGVIRGEESKDPGESMKKMAEKRKHS
jgi:hypothetical protein